MPACPTAPRRRRNSLHNRENELQRLEIGQALAELPRFTACFNEGIEPTARASPRETRGDAIRPLIQAGEAPPSGPCPCASNSDFALVAELAPCHIARSPQGAPCAPGAISAVHEKGDDFLTTYGGVLDAFRRT